MFSSLLAVAALTAPANPEHAIVTVDWLAARLGDPQVVILQVGDDRSKATYDAGHIPGSLFLHPWRQISAPRTEGSLALEMPTARQLEDSLRALGISDGSWVVLVPADEYFTPTTRSYLTLLYAGLERVSILDGGLEAWKAAGKPVTTDVPTPARGSFTPRLHPELIVDATFVNDNRSKGTVAVIDARDTRFYEGADTRQGRNGHIPGATSVPFTSIVTENGFFKDRESLRRILVDAGAQPGDKVVTYCHIGQQATLVWFAAHLLGYDAALYDGSFQDWAKRVELPVDPGKGGQQP